MYLPGYPPLPRHGAVRVPPDVAVEVVTPTPRDVRRDRVEKVDDYAAFGVRYYWIVDPEQQPSKSSSWAATAATFARSARPVGCSRLSRAVRA